jgi:hypothetical protein
MQDNASTAANGANQPRNTGGGRAAPWMCALELNERRETTAGSQAALCDAIRRGADLRIRTDFVYNEHIDPRSSNPEVVREVSDFRVTYMVEDRWAAGIMSLRMPIEPPEGFGPRASMSFFMYNQDGQQAIARPYLDGPPTVAEKGTGPICQNGPKGATHKLDLSPFPPPTGSSPPADHGDMPKYHELDRWDAKTNAPSSNFIYDFSLFRYLVCDNWQEVFAHTAEGETVLGSVDALSEAFCEGREVKVGIRGLCADLCGEAGSGGDSAADHMVFVQTGPGYYCTERRLFSAGCQPVVRVRPAIPMRYASRGWDFGWLMARTDGFVARWLCDPYTLRFQKSHGRYGIRWFVR